MSTKETILASVLKNQPALMPLPEIHGYEGNQQQHLENYCSTFNGIGGKVLVVEQVGDVEAFIRDNFGGTGRILTTLPGLAGTAEQFHAGLEAHSLQDVELAVIGAQFGVAENGAVWLTEDNMGHRILPFICQHLLVVLAADDIVPTMYEAYARIGDDPYGFGVFIGGPSKTADIEQSLVMGAHGPITMTVLLLKNKLPDTN
jgi:L-lactate dehydrogenase complex protein LldG